MSSRAVRHIPRITVQHDFQQVVEDIRQGLHAVEDVWVSCYAEGQQSVHGKARVSESDDAPSGIELESRGGIECVLVNKHTLSVACPALNIPPTLVKFPSRTAYSTKGSLECLDVAPSAHRLAVGGKNGLAQVTQQQSSAQVVPLRGHASDVNAVKFVSPALKVYSELGSLMFCPLQFPSGEVVLSASLDMSVKIFSAVDGSNPRTLRGHSKAVTDLHIVGRGRTVLTSSLDGTVRLWQVSDASLVKRWNLPQPVTAMAVINEQPSDELTGCLCVAAHSNGTATVFDLDSNEIQTKTTLDTEKTSPLHCIALDQQFHMIAVGSRSGTVSVFDCPRTISEEIRAPVACFSRSGATITSLAFSGSNLLVTTSDGLPFEVSMNAQGSVQGNWIEFAGFEAGDSASKGLYVEDKVFIAGGDGVVRMYDIESV
ncbi:hypothetical protein OIV83_004463 [Microbotryomycetes sp. JL201]|nr:hypothetical protein OIV83_004463 [Microbotryomycetes sp. JL201]